MYFELRIAISEMNLHFLLAGSLLKELRSLDESLRYDRNLGCMTFRVAFGVPLIFGEKCKISNQFNAVLNLASGSSDSLVDAPRRHVAPNDIIECAADCIKRVHHLMH